jgi:hypothetical protein
VIPPWAFEYPAEFYKGRNQCRYQLRSEAPYVIPHLTAIARYGIDFMPSFLSAGVPFPAVCSNDLIDWERGFLRLLLPSEDGLVTMPTLFLTLLTHFLEAVACGSSTDTYSPRLYRRFLYPRVSGSDILPLGIFDPLRIISTFIDTLDRLWSHRHSINFSEFVSFRFEGLGLLTGKRSGQVIEETLMAYCGGYVTDKGKCGYSPLIKGENSPCMCGRLICPQCGFCRKGCTRLKGMNRLGNDADMNDP